MDSRIRNSTNIHQGTSKKVLCVCSAGLLRSPTMAHILSAEPFNFNTRSVGYEKGYALIPLDEVHLYWADLVICVEQSHAKGIKLILEKEFDTRSAPEVVVLDCPDSFAYRDPKLVEFMTIKLLKLFPEVTNED